MDRLRTGCPWDARQTHESLAPYLLEETYEAHRGAGQRRSRWRSARSWATSCSRWSSTPGSRPSGPTAPATRSTTSPTGSSQKLTRRHPHVFGDVTVSGAEEVKANWDAIKAAERQAASGAPGSALDGDAAGPARAGAGRRAAAARGAGRGARRSWPTWPGTRPSASVGAELFALAARGPRGGPGPGAGTARRGPRLPRPGPGLGGARSARPARGTYRPGLARRGRCGPGPGLY